MNKPDYYFKGIKDKRMLTIDEAAFYIGMGKTKAAEWLKKVGALRKFGVSARYDKKIIDAALDAEPATV